MRCGSILIASLAVWFLGAPVTTAADAISDELGSIEQLEQLETKIKSVVRNVAPAVVRIGFDGNDKPPKGGSGVVFDETGLVLMTGHHGHNFNDPLHVFFPDGKVVPGVLINICNGYVDWSLAKLRTPGKYPYAPLRDRDPQPNDWCIQLGYPALLTAASVPDTPLLRLGRVYGTRLLRVFATCRSAAGDSGGPLFDLEGHVIGVAKGVGGSAGDGLNTWTLMAGRVDRGLLLADPVLADPDPEWRGSLPKEIEQLGVANNSRHVTGRNHGNSAKGFEQLAAPVRNSTVEVWVDDRRAALGVVVDSDGIILTKRAEIVTRRGLAAGEISCRTPDGQRHEASLVGTSHEHDVALLRIDQQGLTAVPWSDAGLPKQGSLVAALGSANDPPTVGVIGFDDAFTLPAQPGMFRGPLEIEAAEGGVRVSSNDGVNSAFSSTRWPIRYGDLITHVDGQPTPDINRFYKATEGEQFITGDLIQLTIVRNGAALKVPFALNSGQFLGPAPNAINPNDFEGEMSPRRSGFRAVLAHDADVAIENCGGPLIDIQGRVVGVNIARCRKHQMLAIPHTVAKRLVTELLASVKEKQGP